MCTCVCARACAHICDSIIREIEFSFHDNVISLDPLHLIKASNHLNLSHVGLSFCFNIVRLNHDRQLSLR